MDDEIWKWDAKLSWELFSSALYNFRLSTFERKEHKRHSFLKNVILNSITAVEAFTNEVLVNKPFEWSLKKLKEHSLGKKLAFFKIELKDSLLFDSKNIRDDFLVHHKRRDASYFDKINDSAALDAIESSQYAFSKISFECKQIFPYWITGFNFINPMMGNDIFLLNDREFWMRLKRARVNQLIDDIIPLPNSPVIPPEKEEVHSLLCKEIWEQVRKSNFKFTFPEDTERFPHIPILTADWWTD